jgi:hypothetical protein
MGYLIRIWGSGTFHYLVIEECRRSRPGPAKGHWPGAHIGFARATDGADNQSAPVNSITCDIIWMTHHPGGFDLLQLAVNEGSSSSLLWWT